MANDTNLTRWFMRPMVKHSPTLIAFIMRKPERFVMYALRWQQMGSILME
jgi:hypothetical protein